MSGGIVNQTLRSIAVYLNNVFI